MELAGANECEDIALYHHEYREELIAQAAAAVGATYGNIISKNHKVSLTLRHVDCEPSSGSTPLDVTAVHEDQLSWREDIEHRPVELLTFYPPTAGNVSRKAIENLKYDSKLLLDFRGKPIRDFPSLPSVISSMVEGWRIEAWMRSNSRMTMTDIVARIPVGSAVAGHGTPMPKFKSGTMRERARKFRNSAGLISWGPQGSDPNIERFMDEFRSPAQKASNQTIDRNLTKQEKASMALINIGTRPDRAQVGRDQEATQRYLEKARKKADLTYDFDCRAERPETAEEIEDIQDALQQTYSDFAFHTNVPLQVPNSRDSYLDQWNCTQVQLSKIWTNDRTKNTEPPQLFALGKWTVSFDNWVSAPQAYLTYVRK